MSKRAKFGFYIILLLSAMLIFQGCSKTTGSTASDLTQPEIFPDSPPSTSAASGTSTGTAEASRPGKPLKGTITTDALRVRKDPDTDSLVIQYLSKGTVVDILSKTDTKKTVGNSSNFWYQITYNNKTGWCFGDFISINPDYTEKLKSAITALSSGEKVNFPQTANEMQGYAKNVTDSKLIDEAVAALRKVQEGLLPEFRAKLSSAKIPQDITAASFKTPDKIKDADIKKLAVELKENGFSVFNAEGMFDIEVNSGFLLERFRDGMSEKTLDYYTLMADEADKRALADGALLISWEELAARLAGWQAFITKYPVSEEAKNSKAFYHDRYLYFYIAGTPNTPLIDPKTGVLDAKLKESYEKFILKYRNTKDADIVKRAYVILEKAGFKKTDELARFTSMYAIN